VTRARTLSIVIPTLDEERAIGPLLEQLARIAPEAERVVVDGGSEDETVARARARGARVVLAERGRGRQLAVGARESSGEILWFLHADARVHDDAPAAIARALDDARVVAGTFDVVFVGARPIAARFVTTMYRALRVFGVAYGDAAMFMTRKAYDDAGGFPSWTLFEDIDLWGRVKKQGRVVELALPVYASSRRFEGRSFVACFTRWCALQILRWCGVDPETLARRYAPIRERAAALPAHTPAPLAARASIER